MKRINSRSVFDHVCHKDTKIKWKKVTFQISASCSKYFKNIGVCMYICMLLPMDLKYLELSTKIMQNIEELLVELRI